MSDKCQGCGAPIQQPRTGRQRKWCSERCRKRQYAGSCVECGAPTNGYDGPGKASQRCIDCGATYAAAVKHASGERRMREAVDLRRSGLRNAEIAQRMGITLAATSSLIYRAKSFGWDVPRDPYMGNRREAMGA